MEFMELVAMAFERGCGITLEQAFRDSLPEMRERQALYSRLLSSDSDEAIALRAGHIEMGGLLDVVPEAQALKQARTFEPLEAANVVLIEWLGEQLIAAAAECLPKEVKNIALMWETLGPEDQRSSLRMVYDILRDRHQRAKRMKESKRHRDRKGPSWCVEVSEVDSLEVTYYTDDVERAIEHMRQIGKGDKADLAQLALDHASSPVSDDDDPPDVQKGNEIIANYVIDMHDLRSYFGWYESISGPEDYSANDVLPRKYGVIGESLHTPNCLGMSIALLGFSRLAGAPALLASQVKWLVDEYIGAKLPVFTEIQELFEELGGKGTPYYDWSVDEQRFLDRTRRRVMDAHYAIALQLSDGSWWHLDPYQQSLGEFDADWQIPVIRDMLEKYSKVLPGLVLVADDAGALKRWNADWAQALAGAVEDARSIMQIMRELPVTSEEIALRDQESEPVEYFQEEPVWIAETLESLSLFDDFFEKRQAEITALADLADSSDGFNVLKKLIKTQYICLTEELLGFEWDKYAEGDHGEVLAALCDRFMDDDGFRTRRLFALATFMLRKKIQSLAKDYSDGEISRLDPAIELGLPEYNVGLAVASHLRSWTDCDLPGRLLLEYSSSQVYWHEAVDLSGGYEGSDAEDPEVLRAEEMVRNLQHTHRACDRKLDYLAQQRAERGQDGTEDDPSGSGRGDQQTSRSRQGACGDL